MLVCSHTHAPSHSCACMAVMIGYEFTGYLLVCILLDLVITERVLYLFQNNNYNLIDLIYHCEYVEVKYQTILLMALN